MSKVFDVFGLGNAIVDMEFRVSDDEIKRLNLKKGLMSLATSEEQEILAKKLITYPKNQAAGGSTANTMVGVAKFGGKSHFTGKVGLDAPGGLYINSLNESGVNYATNQIQGTTGTCVVLVSPDGERTMQTFLGVSIDLDPADIRKSDVLESSLVYLEGYLWSSEKTKATAKHVIDIAKSNGIPVTLSLSDPSMVEIFNSEFKEVIENSVDIVFCNEHEAAIYRQSNPETSTSDASRESSLESLGADCDLVFMTCGSSGVSIWEKGKKDFIKAHAVTVNDTTGAGDAFASGVIFGLVNQENPQNAARLGSYAAALVVQNFGPRLSQSLVGKTNEILNR